MQAQLPQTPGGGYNRKRGISPDMDFGLDAAQHSGLEEAVPDLDLIKMQKELNLRPEEVLHCYFNLLAEHPAHK